MRHIHRPATVASLSLLLGAGLLAPISTAQPPEPGRDRPVERVRTMLEGADFRSSSWLADRKVANPQGDEIATVSDLVLDRGTGGIEYVVIRAGSTLGLGGKDVAIPYGSFRWNETNEKLILDSTAEQLKQFPEFEAKEWSAMMEAHKDHAANDRTLHSRLASQPYPDDPYASAFDANAKKVHVEGEVKKVERIRAGNFGEYVIITVAANDGTTKKVALGPSWYIGGAASTPVRGDKVVIDAVTIPRDADQMSTASRIRIEQRDIKLRESDGAPTWMLKTVEYQGRAYSVHHWHYLLLSSLKGAKVDCRGQECGKVNDTVVERRSGQLALLSIDPNQNFLGIADTKRLVPWAVANVTVDGKIHIDASKEMILNSPETPSDLAALNSGSTVDSVYKAFDVAPPRFESARTAAPVMPVLGDPWGAKGPFITSIDRNSARTISGKVSDKKEVKFEGGAQPARAITIKAGEQEDTVLLGPAWYIDNQKLACERGDDVSVDAVRTTHNGKTYWLARSMDLKGNKVTILGSGDKPAWDRN